MMNLRQARQGEVLPLHQILALPYTVSKSLYRVPLPPATRGEQQRGEEHRKEWLFLGHFGDTKAQSCAPSKSLHRTPALSPVGSFPHIPLVPCGSSAVSPSYLIIIIRRQKRPPRSLHPLNPESREIDKTIHSPSCISTTQQLPST